MKYLPILLIFVSLAGAGCFGLGGEKVPNLDKNCATVDYPFACYLDKAMLANDPNLCLAAGLKRMNCLRSYEEIMGVDINCDKLNDLEFQTQCKKQEAIRQIKVESTSTNRVIERSVE